jgi:hypothetical protein
MSEVSLNTDICYIDECGMNKHMSREYGRAPKEIRVYLPTPGLIGKKGIGQVNDDWNTTGTWFSVWFEWFLCPLLKAGTVIRSVLKVGHD